MTQKRVLLGYVVLMFFLTLSCSRRMYVHIPPKGWTIGCPFSDSRGCIPINLLDTTTVNQRAITYNFKVTDIKKQKGVYRIIMEVDSLVHYQYVRDSLIQDYYYYPAFEVFSVQTEKMKNYKKIKKGKKYELTLNPYFMHDFLVDFAVREVYIRGISIGIRTGGPNIYTTFNLNGLYYIPPSKLEK